MKRNVNRPNARHHHSTDIREKSSACATLLARIRARVAIAASRAHHLLSATLRETIDATTESSRHRSDRDYQLTRGTVVDRSEPRTRSSAGATSAPQAERVFVNLRIALASVGARFSDVVKATTFMTDVSNAAALREIRAKFLDPARPPANSLIPVPTLARPELLLEIEAVAVLRALRR